MTENKLGLLINKMIEANNNGYEWREAEIIENNLIRIENFFYNPKKKFYDKDLKLIFDEASDSLSKDYFKFFLYHPFKMFKFLAAYSIMRQRAIERTKKQ